MTQGISSSQEQAMHSRRAFLSRGLAAGGLVFGAGLLAACQSAAPATSSGTSAAAGGAAATSAPAGAAATTAPAAATAKTAPAATTAPAAASGASGQTLVVGRLQDALILDPANSGGLFNYTILSLLFDKLLDVGADGKIVGGLASDYTVSPDAKTFTFKLRDGIKFTDGTPLNPETVKANLTRAADPDQAKISNARFTTLQSIDVVDPNSVKIVFSDPKPLFPFYLAAFWDTAVLSPEAVKKYGATDVGKNPVGTGPYMLENWTAGQEMNLVRNPNYVNVRSYMKNAGPPAIERLTFKVIPENQTRFSALQTGDIQLDMKPTPLTVKQVKSDPKFSTITATKGSNVIRMEFETTKPPFDDVNVRRAFSQAVNVDEIIATALEGLAARNYSLIPVGVYGYSDDVKSLAAAYDPNAAGQLLDQAGWKMGSGGVRSKDGNPLEVLMWTYADMETWAPIAQAQVQKVGIKLDLQSFEEGAFYDGVKDAKANIIPMDFNTPDADLVYSSYIWSGKSPFGRWQNDEFVRLSKEARVTGNADARVKLYQQAQALAIKDAAVLPMYTRLYAMVSRPEVKGLVLPPVGWSEVVDYGDATMG
jgi:peptide/nickel transport system substrate-binding protein